MFTSIRDLTSRLQDEAALTPQPCQDVRPALGHLARALVMLTFDGFDRLGKTARNAITAELVTASHSLDGDLSSAPTETRLTRLAAALADSVVLRREDLGCEQRWTVAVQLAQTCRIITSYAGNDPLPSDLHAVRRAALAVTSHAVTDPPVVAAGAWLDAAIPQFRLPAGSALEHAADAAAHVMYQLDRQRDAHQTTTLSETFAVTRAAESALRYAAAVTAALAAAPVPKNHPAPAAWRAIRAELQPFTATAPAQPPDGALSTWALTIHSGLRATFGQPGELTGQTPTGAQVRHVQHIANATPLLADALADVLTRLADSGELHARADRLPCRDDRVHAYLTKRPVVADRFDLPGVQRAIIVAAGHSADLAVELHRLSRGSDQPGFIAAHTDLARTGPHLELPAALRWQPFLDAVDSRITADRHWPTLATQLQRIQDTGRNVAALVNTVIDGHGLHPEHPARSLDYRLSNAIPGVTRTTTGYPPCPPPAARTNPPAPAPPPLGPRPGSTPPR